MSIAASSNEVTLNSRCCWECTKIGSSGLEELSLRILTKDSTFTFMGIPNGLKAYSLLESYWALRALPHLLQDKLGIVDFPMPQFILIGRQSVGKSRLIEAPSDPREPNSYHLKSQWPEIMGHCQ